VNDTIDNAGVLCRTQLACPLCGKEGRVVHAGLRDLIFGAQGEWGFRRCTDAACALMWLDPMPLPAETGKFYGSYYTHSAGATRTRPPDAQRRGWKRVVKRALATVLFWRKHAFLTGLSYLEDIRPGRMLEVGCGNGSLLIEATRAGWQAVGIDFDPNAIAAAQKIPGVQACVGDLFSMAFADGMFDAIVMNNVIEHLPLPDRVFHECQRILRPGGRLVMVTPSTRSQGYRTYGEDWRGLEVPRHLHLFSPATLEGFARAAKFTRTATFSSAGGATGVEMMLFSQALRDKRLQRAETRDERQAVRAIRNEVAAILLGHDIGEWAVLVAHK
jgi:SAM-dependent methyltransferase